MYRPPVPTWVTVGRVLIIIESILWALLGVLFVVAGAIVGGAGSALPGVPGGLVGSAVAVIIVFAVIILALAILGLWSGIAVGKLTGGPRVTGIILCTLGLIVGVLGLLGSGTHTTSDGTEISGSSPLFGVVLIVVNALIIYGWAFDGGSRAAFRAATPAGYPAAQPMMYGTPPPPGTLPPGSGSYGAPGYPQQQPGYPPQQPGYPPQAPPGYPPQQPGYPPQAPPPAGS